MIFGDLAQWRHLAPDLPGMPAAFTWLESLRPDAPSGKFALDGGLVGGIDRYRTAPSSDKAWESHRIHGDIQLLLSGEELLGVGSLEGLTVTRPYDLAKDTEKYGPHPSPGPVLRLAPGRFAILFPGEAHQPGVMTEAGPGDVVKVVVKFRA
jgi:YhcH/YjgK/YiaL family protein